MENGFIASYGINTREGDTLDTHIEIPEGAIDSKIDKKRMKFYAHKIEGGKGLYGGSPGDFLEIRASDRRVYTEYAIELLKK